MRAIAIGAISITILVFASAVTVRLAIGQADSVCVTGTAVATSTPSLIVDCEILLEIKPALRGTAQLNWWTGRSIEQWDGIIVQSGRVAEVSLANRDLNGVIPAGFGDLSDLRTLDLSSNSLTGTIPSELGNLSNLESLSISSNSLGGQIPEALNGLTKLKYLRLSGNDFTGCMPVDLLSVPDSDAASLNLPICGSSTPTPTPTPVPTATPTPTTGERLTTIEARLSNIETRLTAVETAVAQPMATPTPTATPLGLPNSR